MESTVVKTARYIYEVRLRELLCGKGFAQAV
jgi:hypothetical protein